MDVSAGALFDLWGFGFTSDSLPSRQKVEDVLGEIGMDRLKNSILPEEDGAFSPSSLLKDGISGKAPILNYNAVAQGYSCDLVADYLRSNGVTDMLVDIGGEIFCMGCTRCRRRLTFRPMKSGGAAPNCCCGCWTGRSRSRLRWKGFCCSRSCATAPGADGFSTNESGKTDFENI